MKTRKMSKLLALLMAMVMVLAMGTTAFAAGDDGGTSATYKLTISGTTTGHTYDVYQIFAGDVYDNEEADGTTTRYLSNIVWGNGVDGDALLTALKNDTAIGGKFTDCETAADVAEVLENFTAAQMDAFAAIVAENLSETKAASDVQSGSGSTVIEGLEAGYYIVVETTTSVPEGEAYTKYIVQVVGDTEMDVKSGTVTSDKEVIDTNDSTGVTSDWQETADHDIGDTISYRLTGTLPENYADYDGYYYKFTDTLSKGLTLDEDSIEVKVQIGVVSVTLTSDQYNVVVTENNDGTTTFTVEITDLKSLDLTKGSGEYTIDKDTVIYVYYTCTLNEDAVIGGEGNPNTFYLTYSNNPNTAQGGSTDETGDTPKDTNIVFTYALSVNKVDEDKEALEGAGFTLYKWDADAGVDYKGEWVQVDEINEKTTFTFSGLDDGKYKLSETTTPKGYNTMEDIYIVIEATHDETSETLTSLKATFYSDEACTQTLSDFGENGVITGLIQSGTITTDIVNEHGSTLPGTGGMGTTILYIIGIILVAGAGITLVVRRRMNATEKK